MSQTPLSLAGFQVILIGRFWVIAEDTAKMEPKAAQAFWLLAAGRPTIWSVAPKNGMEEALRVATDSREPVKTSGKLNRLVEYAQFGDIDWNLVSDSDVQKALISFLISEHFPDVRREVELL